LHQKSLDVKITRCRNPLLLNARAFMSGLS
jgi:hypothetical protein